MKRPFATTVWREGDWYVSQCLELDIASQGKTEEEALANASGALAGCADNITGGTGRVLEGPTFMRMILAGQFLDDNADDTDAGGTRRYLTVVLSCYGGGGIFSI